MHSLRKIEFEILLNKISNQRSRNLPFVVYSYPNETRVKALLQDNDVMHNVNDFQESGFVFAPFNASQNPLLLKGNSCFLSNYESLKETTTVYKEIEDGDKCSHMDLVKSGIDEIKSGNLKKVVLSRKLEVVTDKNFLEIFKKALYTYVNAFRYIFYHPKVGMWIGASPEQLLKVVDNHIETTSLAGTLPVIGNKKPEWSQKELEEQQMVTDFLKEEILDFVDDIKTTEIVSVKAGKLWHLKTGISASLQRFDLLKNLIDIIHPSPAVCGVPKELAKEFILTSEAYERRYYTGFLGELNLNKEHSVSLFVNLRCMTIESNIATIFVGGGVTEASDPEKEWNETQNKCQTMLALL